MYSAQIRSSRTFLQKQIPSSNKYVVYVGSQLVDPLPSRKILQKIVGMYKEALSGEGGFGGHFEFREYSNIVKMRIFCEMTASKEGFREEWFTPPIPIK